MEKLTTRNAHYVSPWWRYALLIVMLLGMSVLVFISAKAYRDAPPIPETVVGPDGSLLFTGQDILAGQQVFLRYALMENGTIWGHGAYLGPDFSAEYLHTLAMDTGESLAKKRHGRSYRELSEAERGGIAVDIQNLLKENRYDAKTRALVFSPSEQDSYRGQIAKWTEYFSSPLLNGGLPAKYIVNQEELRLLTTFFSWTSWASVANRPGVQYSYTNNFPYEPLVGNRPTSDAILWSMLSVIMLLGGTALVLFAFGRFDYLGWKGANETMLPEMLPAKVTESQKATVKYFLVVTLLFLVQVLVGGAIAHYRADPGNFYGIDLSRYFPSNILRTWHLQLAIFWVATSYVAGGLLLAASLSGRDPKWQVAGVNVLFWALVVVVGGSLFGEMLGVRQLLGNLWYWFGHQGWEYLDLGRAWQVLLAGGLIFWLFLLYRAVARVMKDPDRREIATLFLLGAAAIPFFYLPAFFFNQTSNYSVVDMWRFWIIHLWVEGFFEIFVTVLVAILFLQLGMVSKATAIRVIYLDAILFLIGGIVGTAHHWYWTGQSSIAMAFAAMYSALEVVPLTLLTLEAGNFIKLGETECEYCGKPATTPHKWGFYFLMAVGFWNFLGAGIFGFLINLPIVSYFEVGTMLTPNHGHSAFMGAFGMLAMSLVVIGLRQVCTDEQWKRPEKFVRLSFFGLNIGLALMIIFNLFPGGVLQFRDAVNNGYWHARNLAFLNEHFIRTIEWFRMPGDLVFIFAGVLPAVVASALTYLEVKRTRVTS